MRRVFNKIFHRKPKVDQTPKPKDDDFDFSGFEGYVPGKRRAITRRSTSVKGRAKKRRLRKISHTSRRKNRVYRATGGRK